MYLYMGNQSEEQQKWGERLCWYQAAIDKLNECIKLAKVRQWNNSQNTIVCCLVAGKHNDIWYVQFI